MPIVSDQLPLIIFYLALGAFASYLGTTQPDNNRCRKRKKPRKRRYGIHPINRTRTKQGVFRTLYPLLRDHEERFFSYTRMAVQQFDRLLDLLTPAIPARRSNREGLSVEHRLLLTLRFLASGDSIRSLAYQFRIGVSTCDTAINQMLPVLWRTLQPIYMREPTREDFIRISNEFESIWNLPHCCGCIDGKHIKIFCPKHTGSDFFNYKGYYSINLMACCDANYKFIWVDVGAQGSCGDAGVFRHSVFGSRIIGEEVPVPEGSPLSGDPSCKSMPYFFAGDGAFPLRRNLMRPYSCNSISSLARRVFNYRLSRARLTIENTFGILAARFRIFHRSIVVQKLENADNIVLASVALHNYIMSTNTSRPKGHRLDTNEKAPQSIIEDIQGQREARNASREANEIREHLCNYLFSPAGSVPWQVDRVTQGGNRE